MRLTNHEPGYQPWVISANEPTWRAIYDKLCAYEDSEEQGRLVPKPLTNADRIRAMTDEELAKWLALAFLRVLKRNPMLENPPTYDGLLDWLQKEATDDLR